MEQREAFVIVSRPGTIFNLNDCGIPLDITSHTPVDISITALPAEIEKSMQLREALRTGALVRREAGKPQAKLTPVPAPTFVIPEMTAETHSGRLSTDISVETIPGHNAPASYKIEGEVSDEVREQIEAGVVAEKAEDIVEQQRLLSNQLEKEEREVETSVRTQRKAVPELKPGSVDGQPAGYDFKAPISPALAEANAGMGDQLPAAELSASEEDLDPLAANPPVSKSKK